MNFIEKNTKIVAIILGIATCASAMTTVYAATTAIGMMVYTKWMVKYKQNGYS